MKITYKELFMTFKPAMVKLAGTKISNSKIQYACVKTGSRIEEAGKDYEKARVGILEANAKKGEDDKYLKDKIFKEDEEGKHILDKKGKEIAIGEKYIYETPELEKNALDEVGKLLDMPIELEVHGVDISEFEGIAIEPAILIDLKEFIKME